MSDRWGQSGTGQGARWRRAKGRTGRRAGLLSSTRLPTTYSLLSHPIFPPSPYLPIPAPLFSCFTHTVLLYTNVLYSIPPTSPLSLLLRLTKRLCSMLACKKDDSITFTSIGPISLLPLFLLCPSLQEKGGGTTVHTRSYYSLSHHGTGGLAEEILVGWCCDGDFHSVILSLSVLCVCLCATTCLALLCFSPPSLVLSFVPSLACVCMCVPSPSPPLPAHVHACLLSSNPTPSLPTPPHLSSIYILHFPFALYTCSCPTHCYPLLLTFPNFPMPYLSYSHTHAPTPLHTCNPLCPSL